MNILFLHRKRAGDIGGLSRFVAELVSRFPRTVYTKPIDLVHATDATLLPVAAVVATALGTPYTVTIHGLDLVWPNVLYQLSIKFFLPKARHIIVDSKETLPLLSAHHVDRKRISVIAPGISINQLRKATPFPLPDLRGKYVLITVSNVVPRKGHAWFMTEVLWRLGKNYHYLVVGDGPQKKLLTDLAHQLGLISRVTFLNTVTHGQLTYLLTQVAHIMVFPNRHMPGNWEGFGIAAGEGAAMGLPVLASRVDGLPSVIHHGRNGILLGSRPEVWIQTIQQLQKTGTQNRIGRKAKTYTSSHFSWDTTVTAYRKIFQEVIRRT